MALTVITRAVTLRRFVVYDLEWVPGTLQVRLCGFYDGTRYAAYRSVEEFLDGEMTSRNRGRWFYAHAGGLADIQFILWAIEARIRGGDDAWRVEACFSGSAAIIVKVVRGKNAWHFVDPYWLLRAKLADVAKWMGMEKRGDGLPDAEEEGISDQEYERRLRKRREWYGSVEWTTLRDYNYQDCRILWNAIDIFETTILDRGGQLQMTIASTAMQLFRRKYLSREIPTNAGVNKKADEAYCASRVEVIQHEMTDGWYLDVNSSFPYAMTFPLPGEYLGASKRIPTNDDAIWFADVEIEQPAMALPPVPKRIGGRLFFPSGSWRAWLSGVDVKLLEREGGRVKRCHEVMHFAPFEDMKAYAEDIFAHRSATDDPFAREADKLLMNSLYGKCAEKEEKSALLINPAWCPITQEEQEESGMRELFPGAWIREHSVKVAHRHVPISAYITAIARQTLYDYMKASSEVHYCDTDGFSTLDLPVKPGKELGALKVEKRLKRGRFYTSKLYDLDAEVRNSKTGEWEPKRIIRGKGYSHLTPTRLQQLLEGEAIDHERMSRVKGNWADKRWCGKPHETVIKKVMRLGDPLSPSFDIAVHSLPKRMPYPDGTTRAWDLRELQSVFKK